MEKSKNRSKKPNSLFLVSAFSTLMLLSLSACATRSWVREQLGIVTGRVSETDAKAERALTGLENLELKSKLVLGTDEGVSFGFDSASISDNAINEINEFTSHLPNGSSKIVVAGHTDSTGDEDYNYELGKKRAETVARYLITQKVVDPTRIAVVSYGESSPIADNFTIEGRKKNRRVEILVYEESITHTSQELILE
ncbi:MAG TPA: OmpA family protein [Thermodesulfobacteriota bacterium]|nr:OmpA family protein [Thermodesulfobacteriota bacterium]